MACKGCHNRRTWKNAAYCCAICYRSYGTHHGYYCTREAEADVDTNAQRAVDVLTPTIRWQPDSEDEYG
eukprot:11335155-Heterocapsa_arctica.AAC.1